MTTFNEDEYGSNLYVDLGQDISTGTGLTIYLQPQRGEEKKFTTNIVVGTSNITVDDSGYLANQYLTYTIQDGDLDQPGQWRVRGEALVSGVLIKSDYRKITILP